LTPAEEQCLRAEAAKRDNQDKKLEVLNDILDEVLDKTGAINSELRYQEKILDHLDTRVTETNDRIKEGNRKITKLNK